jgi:hypothetical protein
MDLLVKEKYNRQSLIDHNKGWSWSLMLPQVRDISIMIRLNDWH